jgi:hypothetical protein
MQRITILKTNIFSQVEAAIFTPPQTYTLMVGGGVMALCILKNLSEDDIFHSDARLPF